VGNSDERPWGLSVSGITMTASGSSPAAFGPADPVHVDTLRTWFADRSTLAQQGNAQSARALRGGRLRGPSGNRSQPHERIRARIQLPVTHLPAARLGKIKPGRRGAQRRETPLVPLLATGWSHAHGGKSLNVVPCRWRMTTNFRSLGVRSTGVGTSGLPGYGGYGLGRPGGAGLAWSDSRTSGVGTSGLRRRGRRDSGGAVRGDRNFPRTKFGSTGL
jgi:hypothetical protein